MASDSRIVIVSAGEALIDLVEQPNGMFEAAPGGAPANVAIAAARLGMPSGLLARVSRDSFGARIRDHLADNGVSTRYLIAADEPTPLVVASLHGHSMAYDFWIQDTAAFVWPDHESQPALGREVEVLHVGSVAAQWPSSCERMIELATSARRGGLVVSYDANLRPKTNSPNTRELVRRMVKVADVVKFSDEDLALVCPGMSEDGALQDLGTSPSQIVFVTSPMKVTARWAGKTTSLEGHRVDVVDTVGAGDTFVAAVLYGLTTRSVLRDAALRASIPTPLMREVVRFGMTAATMTCERLGCDPPELDEVYRQLKSRGEEFAFES